MRIPLVPCGLSAALLAPLPGQMSPDQKVAWFPAATIGTAHQQAGGPWLPFVDTPTLTAGRYRLSKGGTDGQQPHDRDEIYFVVAGKARLEAGGQSQPMSAGDTAFVAAHVPHRFVDIEADLDVLVFFSSARAPTGGMAGKPAPTAQTPYAETSQRGNTRIFYWFGPGSAGQVAIDFGRPRWQPAFGKFLQAPAGRRWRFGENFWTTLDTNMGLTIGGVEVPIGQYYVVLQAADEGAVELVLLDPQVVRQRRLDAYQANETSGGIVVPLAPMAAAAPSPALDLELTLDDGATNRATLRIRFGPRSLQTPIVLHPEQPK
ncbi:MAG: cupin domain-containing protein [Planctomycetes bacterium]|nr:cupin domain-containing protein [Planctomycetota bacterium]